MEERKIIFSKRFKKYKFIKTVEELSNTYKIDVDLEEFSEGYVAHIYLDYGCYNVVYPCR